MFKREFVLDNIGIFFLHRIKEKDQVPLEASIQGYIGDSFLTVIKW